MQVYLSAFFAFIIGFQLYAQTELPEFSWQIHPLTEAGVACPSHDGGIIWVTNTFKFNLPERPTIAAFDKNGTERWRTTIDLFYHESIQFEPTQLMQLNEGKYLLAYHSFDCDFPHPPGLLVFDDSGYIIHHYPLDIYDPEPIVVTPVINEPNRILGWFGYGDLKSLMSFDTDSEILINYEYVLKPFKHNPILQYDSNNRLILSLQEGGLGVLDINSGQVSDTLLDTGHHIFALSELPDGQFIAAGERWLGRISNDGDILAEMIDLEYDIIQLWTVNNLIYALCKEYDFHYINIYDENLLLVKTIEKFSDDTRIKGLIADDDRHWIWGNESNNPFAKSIDSNGEYQELEYDAEILEYDYQRRNATETKSVWEELWRYDVSFEDFKIKIKNNGNTILNEIILNVDTIIQFIPWGPRFCEYGVHQVQIKDMHLAPGSSDWYSLDNLQFRSHYVPSRHSGFNLNLCLELSCPDFRIDINHANDKLCKIENFIINTQNEVQSHSGLFIYPNPASNNLIINNIPDDARKIALINLLGSKIADYNLNQKNSILLNIDDVPSGSYMIIIFDKKGHVIMQEKFIKI